MHKDESRYNTSMMRDRLRKVPLTLVDVSTIMHNIKLRFRRTAKTVTILPDPWHPSCKVSEIFVFATALTSCSMNGKAYGKVARTRTGRPTLSCMSRSSL